MLLRVKEDLRKPICDIVFCTFDFGVLTFVFCVQGCTF